jgi:molybdate transport system permease protein
MGLDWQPLWLTLKLAFITSFLLLFIGLLLPALRFRFQSALPIILENIVTLPLVLPPVVLGFYLLVLFSPQSFLGHWINRLFGYQLVFTFPGLVIASIIYSLPFMVQPLLAGLRSIPDAIHEALATLGKSYAQSFIRVYLPMIKPQIAIGMLMSFAHTVGEFGVVLIIGGNIPAETKVASIAIYEAIETLNYPLAHRYALILFLFSFVATWLLRRLQRHA